MTPRFRTCLAPALAGAALLALAGGAHAACPDSPCDCYGAAAGYRVVARRDLLDFNSTVYGSLCAETAVLTDRSSEGSSPDDYTGNVHVRGASGVVVRARIPRPKLGDEVFVDGVLATGGGSVIGPITAGVLDTTGTHPGVASCQQAAADVLANSYALAALAPTQIVPQIVATDPGTTQFAVGPGVNVIQVDGAIAVRDGILEIVLDPGTEAVVFNARSFSMRRLTRLYVTGGEDTKVIVNVVGLGPSVVVKSASHVEPTVLAPERIVRVKGSRFASLFGRRLRLRESVFDASFDTCASPSGAFLDAADPL